MRLLTPFVSAICLAGAACSHDPRGPRTARDDFAPVSTLSSTSATVTRSDQVMNVGPGLRQACGIDDVSRAPKFDFDSSNLSSNDRDVLAQVATCLATGPMTARSISLVARADPRSDSEYNLSLGEERATAGRAYLEQLGVEDGRLRDTPRGAPAATGHLEATWRQNRRVDIELAD